MEAELILASQSIFGTGDYESVLSILPAYDGAVKEFRRLEKQIHKKYDDRKDDYNKWQNTVKASAVP